MHRRRCFLGIGGRAFHIEEGAFGDRRGAFGVKDVFCVSVGNSDGGRSSMEIHVSVRQLVEFILREGNIDNRKLGVPDSAMQEGSRIHRMLQRRMGSEYHAEVGLKLNWAAEGYDIIIEGRADGIIDSEWEMRLGKIDDPSPKKPVPAMSSNVVIDEIKGTYKELRRIQNPVRVHLAQAKCYAYIYAKECGLDQIGVRMTYCHIETEEVKYFHEDYTFEELERWFCGLINEYKKWSDFQFEWYRVRTDSMKALAFPFPYREGQKELAANVYRTIYHKRKLFLEAPTGVGKTISTVFPTVKAMGEGLVEKIFYLTAKTITRTVAQECFSLLQQNGLLLKTIVITAKEKICFLTKEEGSSLLGAEEIPETEEVIIPIGSSGCECNPDACPYAKGHYDRINEAMYDLLVHEDHFTREKVLEYAQKHQVCPFEMSLDMSLFADAVICDYNYVFDPRVYLKRFFAEGLGKKDYAFLIDEAHNLLERGREMYSASLFKEDFLHMKKLLRGEAPKVTHFLEKCNRELLVMKRRCESYQKESEIDGFVMALNHLYGALDDFLDDNEVFSDRDEILEFYFEICHFLNMYEIMDNHYIVYSQLTDEKDFMLKLFCVDPSRNLQQCMQKGRSTVLFSATLLPIQYYKRLLGGDSQDYEVYAKSTFDEEKKALFIANDVTSKYTRRNNEEYYRIAQYIDGVVRERNGNYMVFLPSHLFLDQVYQCFMEEFYKEDMMECIVQEDRMSEAQREEFLLRFQGNMQCSAPHQAELAAEARGGQILIGFCVMGGIFSEGIDLKRDSLIGAIIVGTGIPQVCCERELLKSYFDAQGESGFNYAYRYPGMNKVLQSAGRVIRTAEDVGVVVLLDERFLELSYRKMFPREWSRYEIVGVEGVARHVQKFWNAWLE